MREAWSVAVALFMASSTAVAQKFYVPPDQPSGFVAGIASSFEQIEDIVLQLRKAPAVAGVFRQLRFSPDGAYAFAQDGSGLKVLTVKPFVLLFRAAAEKDSPAIFTMDSREIVFVGADASGTERVERWSLTDRKQISATPVDLHACETKALSPSGAMLVCVESGGVLRLIDVASGRALLEKSNFAKKYTLGSVNFTCNDIRDTLQRAANPVTQGAYETAPVKDPKSFHCDYGDPGSAWIDFSPDGRFLLARPDFAEGSPVLRDTAEKKQMKLSGELKQLQEALPQDVNVKTAAGRVKKALVTFERQFVFLSQDRIMLQKEAFRDGALADAEVVSLPSGKAVSKAQLPAGAWSRITDPAFVLVRPFGAGAALAVDYGAGSAITSKASGLDVLGNMYLAERSNGDIGLYERGKGLVASASIPPN